MKTAQMLHSNADSQIGEDLEQPGGRTHSDRDKKKFKYSFRYEWESFRSPKLFNQLLSVLAS